MRADRPAEPTQGPVGAQHRVALPGKLVRRFLPTVFDLAQMALAVVDTTRQVIERQARLVPEPAELIAEPQREIHPYSVDADPFRDNRPSSFRPLWRDTL